MLRDDFTIYGVNEVQYSDLPADDMLTWYDQWNLAQFIVCMVTPNDPIVKEYAAAITKRLGGTLAGATQDPDQVAELMKATYNYMRETGMRYASAEGVPVSIGDVKTLVQTVRLPRDVITSNNGLCIELAILWASILDQLGCQTFIVMRPGHAFTIVQAGDKYFPVECTAITPKAVGATADVPFEKAVEMASEDLQKQQYKIFFSVQQYRSQGYASPELPDVDVDKIKAMLASRERKRWRQRKILPRTRTRIRGRLRKRKRGLKDKINRNPGPISTRDVALRAQCGAGFIFLSGFLESSAAAHPVGHHLSRLRSVDFHGDGRGGSSKRELGERGVEGGWESFCSDRQSDSGR